jgi:Zn finger protein HypA/HybF involved in hydrogenase expression
MKKSITLANLLVRSARLQFYKHNLSKILETVLHLGRIQVLKEDSVMYYMSMMK